MTIFELSNNAEMPDDDESSSTGDGAVDNHVFSMTSDMPSVIHSYRTILRIRCNNSDDSKVAEKVEEPVTSSTTVVHKHLISNTEFSEDSDAEDAVLPLSLHPSGVWSGLIRHTSPMVEVHPPRCSASICSRPCSVFCC